MQKVRFGIVSIFLLMKLMALSQNANDINVYINTYKNLAIAEMQRTGVPASITLAQGIHETAAGTSELVLKSNNHFGIKCKSYWTGESVRHNDDANGECFRKYADPDNSYKDHSDFLKSSQRYSFLFSFDPTDYKSWAYGLKKAGYATNRKYPDVLIRLIEDYQLQDYTLMALGKMPVDGVALITTNETKKGNPVFVSIQNSDTPGSGTSKEEIKEVQYPEGEFTIHSTKVIYARKGTSFLAIATHYKIPLWLLFDFNDLDEQEVLEKDQLIFLQRKRKTGKNEYHIMQPGETLYDIAQTEAIRLESLLELNWLKKNEKPAPGEQLSLHKKSAVIPKLTVKENYSLTPGNKSVLPTH